MSYIIPKVYPIYVERVCEELQSAEKLFPPFNSPHEGWAVIHEELEELWREVRKRGDWRELDRLLLMRDEAMQVSAMGMRFMKDICDANIR